MQIHRSLHLLILASVALFLLVSCGGQAEPQPTDTAGGEEPAQEATRAVTETVVEEGEGQTAVAPAPSASVASPTQAATQAPPLATAEALEEIAEVEWPGRMRLGESDVVRLSLLPTDDGYEVLAEFAGHRTVTETVTLEQLAGYDVIAAARLDGVGFHLAPEGDQPQDWRAGRALTWRWTISPRRSGQQRLSLSLTMQWRPEAGRSLPSRQVTAFSRALDVQVVGGWVALSDGQMLLLGLAAITAGLAVAVALLRRRWGGGASLTVVQPDPALRLEPHPSLALDEAEQTLLKAVFRGYSRASVEGEFRSGYSGARTFLVMPIRADGRADAYTIAKLGARQAIEREYQNYVTYVEHTLPPVTARIQGRPVAVQERGALRGANGLSPLAALRYTFIGAPGQQPRSLRQALLDGGGPLLLEKLFRTFGPNWWMQRRPYTFRLALEYDCKLPVHALVAPEGSAAVADLGAADGDAALLAGSRPPARVSLAVGDRVTLRGFKVAGHKREEDFASLVGEGRDGAPPLRLRWLGAPPSDGVTGRVVATRQTLLQQWTAGIERHGLPDPLQALPELMARTISGSRSIIHGDLNTENALVGPGEIVWLIDFASTREGHTLFDFAHLGAQLVAHVLPHRYADSDDYLRVLAADEEPLLNKLQAIAGRCLADAQQPDEFRLPLLVSCLGALKHRNLDARARAFLYVTGAYLVEKLRDGD